MVKCTLIVQSQVKIISAVHYITCSCPIQFTWMGIVITTVTIVMQPEYELEHELEGRENCRSPPH